MTRAVPAVVAQWLLLSAIVGCAPNAGEPKPSPAATENDAAADALLQLMRERLLLMHDVARWKWNTKKPISDPEREQALLAELQRRGAEHGLTPDEVRTFMRAQIEAGKLIQQADWRQWEAERREAFADAPDLQTELRPKIDRLSERLLEAYAEFVPQLAEPGARERLERRAQRMLVGEGIDEQVREQSIEWSTMAARAAAPTKE
jgi:chorismate mutase